MFQFRHLLALFVVFAILSLVGCGPSHYTPPGKITKGGQPFTPSDKAVVNIALYPESDKSFGDAHPVVWEKGTGNFKVTGKTGNGVPAGKYILSITIVDPYPEGKDLIGGALNREKGMPVEIKDSSTEIKVEIEKK